MTVVQCGSARPATPRRTNECHSRTNPCVPTGVDEGDYNGHIHRMSDPTAVVRTRVPVRRLQRAEKILHKLGLTPADAVNMLLAQIEIHRGLPFEVSTRLQPLSTSEEQAAAWTEAFGVY